MKKLRVVLGSFMICFLMLLAAPAAVNAAAKKPVCQKKQTVEFQKIAYPKYYFEEDYNTCVDGFIYIKNLSPLAVITDIKSSNKYYSASKPDGLNAIEIVKSIVPKSATHVTENGEKTRISFTVKQNGKKYKLSCLVTFKESAPRFKTFKIGNDNEASRIKGFWQAGGKAPETKKAKIQITPAKNYKIDYIEADYGKGNIKKVKNGSSISTKNLQTIRVVYHTTKKPAYYQRPAKCYQGNFFDLPTPLDFDFGYNLY